MATITLSETLSLFNCTECGAPIVLAADRERRLRNTHASFWCPNGHAQHFPSESDSDRAKRLEKELAEHKVWLQHQKEFANHVADQLNSERKSHAVTKGQLTRTRKRIAHGVCPECNRTFQNVARHMQSKHAAAPAPEASSDGN